VPFILRDAATRLLQDEVLQDSALERKMPAIARRHS
jgi:hypothetical protein